MDKKITTNALKTLEAVKDTRNEVVEPSTQKELNSIDQFRENHQRMSELQMKLHEIVHRQPRGVVGILRQWMNSTDDKRE